MSLMHPPPRRGTALAAALVAAAMAPPPLPAQTAAQRQPARPPAAAPAAATTPAPAPAAAPTATQPVRVPAAKSTAPVTLNFVNADIEAVSRAMGALLDRPLLVDPRVKGNITLYSDQPLSVREAYINYLAALRGLGFAVVESGGLLKVVPEADAKLQTGTVSIGDVARRGDQVITQIFRLNHENANSLVAVLRPLISPNNTINANPSNNSLVITDYAENLTRLAKIIAALDVAPATDVEVIPLKHAVAVDLAPVVQRLLDGGAPGAPPPPGVPGAQSASLSILVDTRSNSLIVRAANPTRMAAVRSLVERLDQPSVGGAGAAGNIHVVYLKNADAVRLAAVLRAAYGAGGGTAGQAGAATTPGAAGGAPLGGALGAAATPVGATTTGTGASPQSTAPVAATAGPSTGGFIQADPATNALIITAPDPVYRQLRAVIEQLDSRRAQVYIESMIVRVDASKMADIGFQWQGILGRRGDSNLVGAGTNFSGAGNIIQLQAGAAAGTVLPRPGLNIALVHQFSGTYALASLANFLVTNTGANVLSTPNMVSLDNEEAKIVVGQNVPFVTGSFTNTGAGGGGAVNPFQTIERRDVGLTLRVRPQIGENGTVRMTIYQENSDVILATLNNPAGPTTDKTSIETSVVVDDGQILALGGLLRDDYGESTDKVPGLGDVPYLGGLFRAENRTRSKSNLMLFLRPVVLRTQQAADTLTLDRYDLIRSQQEKAQPRPHPLMPINESVVLPPLRGPGAPIDPRGAGYVWPVAPAASAPASPAATPALPASPAATPAVPPSRADPANPATPTPVR